MKGWYFLKSLVSIQSTKSTKAGCACTWVVSYVWVSMCTCIFRVAETQEWSVKPPVLGQHELCTSLLPGICLTCRLHSLFFCGWGNKSPGKKKKNLALCFTWIFLVADCLWFLIHSGCEEGIIRLLAATFCALRLLSLSFLFSLSYTIQLFLSALSDTVFQTSWSFISLLCSFLS